MCLSNIIIHIQAICVTETGMWHCLSFGEASPAIFWHGTFLEFVENFLSCSCLQHHDKMSRNMTKPTKSDCVPQSDQESSQCVQWVAKDPGFLHADSEDWSDWADAQADLSLRLAHICLFCHAAAQIVMLPEFAKFELWNTFLQVCESEKQLTD